MKTKWLDFCTVAGVVEWLHWERCTGSVVEKERHWYEEFSKVTSAIEGRNTTAYIEFAERPFGGIDSSRTRD
jgi:hypothetical protein